MILLMHDLQAAMASCSTMLRSCECQLTVVAAVATVSFWLSSVQHYQQKLAFASRSTSRKSSCDAQTVLQCISRVLRRAASASGVERDWHHAADAPGWRLPYDAMCSKHCKTVATRAIHCSAASADP